MKTIAATAILALFSSAAVSQPVQLGGEIVAITAPECVEALEKGNVIPNSSRRNDSRDLATVVYDGKIFLVGFEGEGLVCVATSIE